MRRGPEDHYPGRLRQLRHRRLRAGKPGVLAARGAALLRGGPNSHGQASPAVLRPVNLPTVRSELDGLGYLVWLATQDGNKLSPNYTPGLCGVQYAGGPTADYDTSILYGVW